MKFVIDALGLTAAGGKQLALDLCAHLAKFDDHQFVALLPNLSEYARLKIPNLNVVLHQKPRNLLLRHLYLNRTVPKVCMEEHADALLCLGNFPPRTTVCPTVVLLQNAYLVYRDAVAESRLTLRQRLILAYGRHGLRRISPRVRVVVQTQVMRNRLLSLYGVDPDKVSIIPNGCSLSEQRDGSPLNRPRDGTAPFTFLCLGQYYAHKNQEILLDAMQRLQTYMSRPAKCLLTISAGQHPGAKKLLERIATENLGHALVNQGPVPTNNLAEVYRSADALVFPSLLESFTRTYLEAMHFGLPILTSDRDFARDRCQHAALYFDPLDADSVAKSMARIMEDSELRARLVAEGKRILAQSPSWDDIAAQFVAALEQAAGIQGLSRTVCAESLA